MPLKPRSVGWWQGEGCDGLSRGLNKRSGKRKMDVGGQKKSSQEAGKRPGPNWNGSSPTFRLECVCRSLSHKPELSRPCQCRKPFWSSFWMDGRTDTGVASMRWRWDRPRHSRTLHRRHSSLHCSAATSPTSGQRKRPAQCLSGSFRLIQVRTLSRATSHCTAVMPLVAGVCSVYFK